MTIRNICGIMTAHQKERNYEKMKATVAVREIMTKQNQKVAALADQLNIKSNVLCERLGQENISIAKLDEMVRAMGYKIVVMPRETREQEGWYRVE